MARFGVRITIREASLRKFIDQDVKAGVKRAAETTANRARNNLSQAGRYDTNALDRSIRVQDITTNPNRPRFAVGSPLHYAKYQEFGTKAHGPVRAKFLRFKPKGSSTFVFTKWVRGIKPLRFMERALKSLTVYDYLN